MKAKIYSFCMTTILALTIFTFTGTSAQASDKVIPYPPDYNLTSEGASAYHGIGNVKHSPYYSVLDFYDLKSTKNLTILSNYKTYQQTTEISCGPSAALTVLYHFGNTTWDEKKLMASMDTKPAIGTDTAGMVKFFKQIDWNVSSSLDQPKFSNPQDVKNFILKNLKNNTPIMVENIEWGGHWRVIIGYDTMGTDTIADDVLILADSYDTADHQQDGYTINPAEKFFYMWFDAHMLPQGQQDQQWVVASPQ